MDSEWRHRRGTRGTTVLLLVACGVLATAQPSWAMSGLGGLADFAGVVIAIMAVALQVAVSLLVGRRLAAWGFFAATLEGMLILLLAGAHTGEARLPGVALALASVAVTLTLVVAALRQARPTPLRSIVEALAMRPGVFRRIARRPANGHALVALAAALVLSSPFRGALLGPVGFALGGEQGRGMLGPAIVDVVFRGLCWMAVAPIAWFAMQRLSIARVDPGRLARPLALAAVPVMLVPHLLFAGLKLAVVHFHFVLEASSPLYFFLVQHPNWILVPAATYVALRAALPRREPRRAALALAMVCFVGVRVVGWPLRMVQVRISPTSFTWRPPTGWF